MPGRKLTNGVLFASIMPGRKLTNGVFFASILPEHKLVEYFHLQSLCNLHVIPKNTYAASKTNFFLHSEEVLLFTSGTKGHSRGVIG